MLSAAPYGSMVFETLEGVVTEVKRCKSVVDSYIFLQHFEVVEVFLDAVNTLSKICRRRRRKHALQQGMSCFCGDGYGKTPAFLKNW